MTHAAHPAESTETSATGPYREVGPAGEQTAEEVLAALRMPSQGKVYSLALPRYTGMPLFGSHPPFQVTMYRTPAGLRGDGVEPWGPHNEVNLQYMAESVSGTAHSGAHVDALAHMTIGDDDHWYGGGNAREHLGDRGPTVGDGSKLPPFLRRGVLLDVPGYLGVDALDSHQPVDAEQLQQVAAAQGVSVGPGDVVLISTGYLGAWPDPERMARHTTAGPDISAARVAARPGRRRHRQRHRDLRGAAGPRPRQPGQPAAGAQLLLIEHGIYLFEGIYLEELAREKIYEFLFVALPLKIQGTTGSMLDPVAIV